MNYSTYERKMAELENKLLVANTKEEKEKITKKILKLESTADIGLY